MEQFVVSSLALSIGVCCLAVIILHSFRIDRLENRIRHLEGLPPTYTYTNRTKTKTREYIKPE
jgi:hypothetical protein